MANKNQTETTAKFNVDITELRAGMQEAARQVRLAKSEFKAATSGLDNWSKSADGVEAKIKELNTTLDAQKKQLDILEQQYKLTAESEGETSKGAEELKVKLNNKKAAIGNTEKQLRKYNDSLKELLRESKEASEGTDDLREELDDTGGDVAKVSEGFTVMKGAISSLIADGIKLLVSSLKDQLVDALGEAEQAYNSFQTKIGASTEDMQKYREAINNVYKDNFGESLQDVADIMAEVKEQTNELDPSKLQDMTEKAITLRDTFDMDMGETLRGINGLMVNMGLTADEAFEYMAAGAQNGLDKTDELGDNIAEYSQLWGQAGFGAKDMFAILQNGLDSGAYNLDKVNDFVKEFTISLADGRIKENLGKFSSETKTLFKEWKSGKKTAKDVFKSVTNDLSKMTNKQEALTIASDTWSALGEDNAMDVITSLNQVNDKYDDVKGTMKEIQDVKYDDPLNQISELGRRFQVDFILPMAKKALPTVQKFFDFTINHMDELVGIIKNVGIAIGTAFVATKITTFVGTIMQAVSVYGSLSAALTTATVAQGGLNVAMLANPVGILIGGIALLAGGLAAYSLATRDATDENDELNRSIEETKKEHEALRDELARNAEARKEVIKQSEVEGNKAQFLMERIRALNKVEKKSNGQKKLMKKYVQELNEIYPELNIQYDEEKDKLNKTTKALKNQVKWQKELAKAKALENAASSYMTDIVNEELNNAKIKSDMEAYEKEHKNVKKLSEELDAIIEKQKGMSETSLEYLDLDNQYMEKYQDFLDAGGEKYMEMEKDLNESENRLKSLNGQYDETIEKVNGLYNDIDIGRALDQITSKCKKAGVEIPKAVSDGIKSGRYSVPESVKQMKNLIEFDAAIKKAGLEGEKIPKKLQKGILSGKISVKDGVKQLANAIDEEEKKIAPKSEKNGQKSGKSHAKGVSSTKNENKNAAKTVGNSGVDGFKSTLGLYGPLAQKVGPEIASGMSKGKGRVKTEGKGLANSGKRGFDSVKFSPSGENIVTGVNSGVDNKSEALRKRMTDLAQNAVSWFNEKLGIHSPSRVFAREAKWIPAGIAKGVDKNQGIVEKSIVGLAKAAVKSLTTYSGTNYELAGTKAADAFTKGLESSIKVENKSFKELINDTVKKSSKKISPDWFGSNYDKELKKLRDKYKKDSKKLSSETKKLNEKYSKQMKKDFSKFGESSIKAYTESMAKAAEKAENKVKATIEKLTKAAQEKYDAVYEKQTSMQEKMAGFGDLFTVDSRGNYRLSSITDQTATLKDYMNNIDKLKGKVSNSLLEEISEMSVEDAVGYTNALLRLSEEELTAYNQAYEEKQKYAKTQAKNFYADQVKTIEKEFSSKVKKEFDKIEGNLKKSGVNATKGFIKGLKSNKKDLENASKFLADTVVKQVNKSLGIHSPSKVFEQMGIFSGKGYLNGLKNTMSNVSTVMGNAVKSLNPQLNSANAGTVINNYNTTLNQTNNSPRPLDRLEIYRQTRNQLNFVKGV